MRRKLFARQWAVTCLMGLMGLSWAGVVALTSDKKVPGGSGHQGKVHQSHTASQPVPVKVDKVVLSTHHEKAGTQLTPDPVVTLLVMATLDGTLTAVDRVSGEQRWVTKDEPMIKVPVGPTSTKAPYFLPDPKSGSLYVMGRRNSLRKLPFTIPQLVAMAPCRNSEGLMYTGKKLDYWLTLNPNTGEKAELPSYGESTCPARPEDDVYDSCAYSAGSLKGGVRKSLVIGKTEYTLSMVEGRRKWNVTYHHYSSVDMSPQSAQDYEFAHFTSPSTGTMLTYDRETGQLLWQKELDSPIIAVYSVDQATSNLVSVPFNPIAPETLDKLKNVASQSNQPLSPTTYIGESNYGLYAVPTLVDDTVLLMGSDGTTPFPPLLEGPTLENNNDTPPAMNTGNSEPSDGKASTENDIVIYGYYKVPDPPGSNPPATKQIESFPNVNPVIPAKNSDINPNSIPPGYYNESDAIIGGNKLPPDSKYPSIDDNLSENISNVSPNIVKFPPFPIPIKTPPPMTPAAPREIKPIKIVISTAVISVAATIGAIIAGYVAYRKWNGHFDDFSGFGSNHSQLEFKKNSKNKVSDAEEDGPTVVPVVRKPKKSADGSLVSIGKISFSPTSVLGKGCEGTFVFKGKFEGRECAVKRILPECFAFADREVDLLKESDQHPNVIRYFCTESDGQFRYIALELCEATLSDWIEGKFVSEFIDPINILREATDGLAHLHSLQIVHRDVKPANVLLSVGPNGTQVKTLISDFGLCKKITNGRMSFSRRSGGIPGTDGWIAPEVIKNMSKEPGNLRMSYSVDVFSLGCVYYFVLTNGDHPFGEPFRRQSNIVTGECNLNKISQNPKGILQLINLMISQDASRRPPLADVLAHPMFWAKDKVLSFFLDVSDRIEKEDENKCGLLRRLESNGTAVVRQDWRDHICTHVAMDLRKYRTYKGHSVRDLLRALRNKKNHYRELTPEAQESLGHIPEQFVDYWIFRFPDMLPYTWLKFESVKHEPIFSKYYPKAFSFNEGINGESSIYEDEEDYVPDRLGVTDENLRGGDKSPKIDKNFWRSKSQFKTQKWRQQQQKNHLRENPSNFVSFGTRYSVNSQPVPNSAPSFSSPDTDNSWRVSKQ